MSRYIPIFDLFNGIKRFSEEHPGIEFEKQSGYRPASCKREAFKYELKINSNQLKAKELIDKALNEVLEIAVASGTIYVNDDDYYFDGAFRRVELPKITEEEDNFFYRGPNR